MMTVGNLKLLPPTTVYKCPCGCMNFENIFHNDTDIRDTTYTQQIAHYLMSNGPIHHCSLFFRCCDCGEYAKPEELITKGGSDE